MGSSIKDKLTGNCESCEERKKAMIKYWKDYKKRWQEAARKAKKQ